jgi:hypothetical protein
VVLDESDAIADTAAACGPRHSACQKAVHVCEPVVDHRIRDELDATRTAMPEPTGA